VRRALKILDTLLQAVGEDGFRYRIAPRESSYYQGSRDPRSRPTGREQVQITVTEKTTQRANPHGARKKRYVELMRRATLCRGTFGRGRIPPSGKFLKISARRVSLLRRNENAEIERQRFGGGMSSANKGEEQRVDQLRSGPQT